MLLVYFVARLCVSLFFFSFYPAYVLLVHYTSDRPPPPSYFTFPPPQKICSTAIKNPIQGKLRQKKNNFTAYPSLWKNKGLYQHNCSSSIIDTFLSFPFHFFFSSFNEGKKLKTKKKMKLLKIPSRPDSRFLVLTIYSVCVCVLCAGVFKEE